MTIVLRKVVWITGFLLFMGCNSSDAYKEQVNALNGAWEMATTEVNSFAEVAAKELDSWNDMYEGMYSGNEEVLENISAEKKATLDSLDAVCKSHGDQYRLINQELSELQASWKSNGEVLQQINTALENNALTEEQAGVITQLEQQVTTATEQINSWTSKMGIVKKECFMTCQEYARQLDAKQPE